MVIQCSFQCALYAGNVPTPWPLERERCVPTNRLTFEDLRPPAEGSRETNALMLLFSSHAQSIKSSVEEHLPRLPIHQPHINVSPQYKTLSGPSHGDFAWNFFLGAFTLNRSPNIQEKSGVYICFST